MGKAVGALCFLTLGLILMGVWTDVVGYSVNLLAPETLQETASFNSDAYLWGRLIFGLLLFALARHIPRIQTTLAVAVALIMSTATGLLVLSFHQFLLDPYVFSSVTIFIAGGCYITIISFFYILFAQRIETSQVVVCIAISLVLETVSSILISLYLHPIVQTFIVVLAPLLVVSCYFIGERLSKECTLSAPPQKVTGLGKYFLLIQVIIFSTLLVLIRILSNVGVWGGSRGNFLGMQELSVDELVIISLTILVLSYVVFILPAKRLSLQVRCVIAFAVLLAGLQLLAFSNDYQLFYLFDSVTTAVSLFAHLAFWMMVITTIRQTDTPAFRVTSVARPFYALITLAWVHFFEQQSFITSAFVMVIIYVLLIAVLLMLVSNQIRGAFASRDPEQAVAQGEFTNRLLIFERAWGLSQRESEVFELLVSGKKYREIGAACDLSDGTVKTHVSNIYRKLDVHSKGEMLALLKEADPSKPAVCKEGSSTSPEQLSQS